MSIVPRRGFNRRQQRSYEYSVDLYKPLDISVSGSYRVIEDQAYPEEATYKNVKCGYNESSVLESPSEIGRTNYDILLTIDHFEFNNAQAIEGGWAIHMRSPRIYNDVGKWWIVQGSAQDRPPLNRRRANSRTIYAKRSPAPDLTYP